MRLVLAMTIALVLSGPLAAVAADASLKDFRGEWHGVDVSFSGDPLGIELRPEDLDVTITPERDGFRLHWIGLEQDDRAGTFVRRESEAHFRATDRSGVFAYHEVPGTLLGRMFASPSTGNPLQGETLLWARLDGPTLIVYSLRLLRGGGFELHRAAHTLEDGAMSLEHVIRTEGGGKITIRGRLQAGGS